MLGRLVSSAAVAVLLPTSIFQAGDQLKGVGKVTVEVLLAAREVPSWITEDRLRTILELRLRTAGFKVLSDADDRKDGDVNPRVLLDINIIPARLRGGPDIGYAFSSRLSLREYRASVRNQAILPIELWARSYLDIASSQNAASGVEKTVADLLDELINEWLKANPR
jgi:hypothetical protein